MAEQADKPPISFDDEREEASIALYRFTRPGTIEDEAAAEWRRASAQGWASRFVDDLHLPINTAEYTAFAAELPAKLTDDGINDHLIRRYAEVYVGKDHQFYDALQEVRIGGSVSLIPGRIALAEVPGRPAGETHTLEILEGFEYTDSTGWSMHSPQLVRVARLTHTLPDGTEASLTYVQRLKEPEGGLAGRYVPLSNVIRLDLWPVGRRFPDDCEAGPYHYDLPLDFRVTSYTRATSVGTNHVSS